MSQTKRKLSYLTQTQEVAMVLSRFLRDVDAMKHLLRLWIVSEYNWNREFHIHIQIYQHHNDLPPKHHLLFDIQHFYPKFLARLNPTSRLYEDMPIKAKIRVLTQLNADEETISMRRKSMYLFRQKNVDKSRNYPMEHMIHQNSAEFLVGVMNYRGVVSDKIK